MLLLVWGRFYPVGGDRVRLLFVFAVVTLLCVVGIDRVMFKPVVPMDKWVCEPKLIRVQTNNGPFYYHD